MLVVCVRILLWIPRRRRRQLCETRGECIIRLPGSFRTEAMFEETYVENKQSVMYSTPRRKTVRRLIHQNSWFTEFARLEQSCGDQGGKCTWHNLRFHTMWMHPKVTRSFPIVGTLWTRRHGSFSYLLHTHLRSWTLWGMPHSTKVLFTYASSVGIQVMRPMEEVEKAQLRNCLESCMPLPIVSVTGHLSMPEASNITMSVLYSTLRRNTKWQT